jgi:hypothetical protein
MSSGSTEFPTLQQAAVIANANNRNNRGKNVRKVETQPASVYGATISVQTHNRAIKTLQDQIDSLSADRAALQNRLRSATGQMEDEKLEGTQVDDEKLLEQAKKLEGINAVSMGALIDKAEPLIDAMTDLKKNAVAVAGNINDAYKNSTDRFKLLGSKKSSNTLMQDLGIEGVTTQVKDKTVVTHKPIAGGSYEQFQNTCMAYKKIAYAVNKCLSELLKVQREGDLKPTPLEQQDQLCRIQLCTPEDYERNRKVYMDLYTKICEMRNLMHVDKTAIDSVLATARSEGNWVADRHYEGIGMTEYADRNDKTFKFVPIYDEVAPAAE